MSNNTCANCGAKITCGCQVKIASDGTKCCSQCIAQYEESLKKK